MIIGRKKFYRTTNNVITNYISNDKILKFRGLKKAPNSSRVRCNHI